MASLRSPLAQGAPRVSQARLGGTVTVILPWVFGSTTIFQSRVSRFSHSENLNALLALSVHNSQKHLVASNERSLAQAHFEESAWFRAVYADEEPVGFVMLHDETLRAEPREQGYVFLWRMMVDGRFQGMGFGWRAMALLIDHARTRPHDGKLRTSWHHGEGSSEGFYLKLGFIPTDVDEEEEMQAYLEL